MAQLIRRSPKKLKRRKTNEAVSQVVEASKKSHEMWDSNRASTKKIDTAQVSSVDPD